MRSWFACVARVVVCVHARMHANVHVHLHKLNAPIGYFMEPTEEARVSSCSGVEVQLKVTPAETSYLRRWGGARAGGWTVHGGEGW